MTATGLGRKRARCGRQWAIGVVPIGQPTEIAAERRTGMAVCPFSAPDVALLDGYR